MTAPFPFGFDVEVERGTRNEHGDITWTVHHTIPGCAWAPRTSDESDDRRTTVIVGLTLYGPFGADLLFDDRVVLPAVLGMPTARKLRTYRVIGDRGDWRNPFNGWTPGFEAALERVT